MNNIFRLEDRPDSELVEALSKFGTAMIADSMGRYGAMLSYIRPLHRGTHIAGPAVTVQTYRSDNLMLHVGLELAEVGDVLVVNAGEVENAGIWGDLMTRMALKKKLGGLILDGAVRDTEQLCESGFGVFSKSISPMGGFKQSAGSVNMPIACGGMTVNPGDIVIGDDDGVVVIAKDRARDVLAACEKTEEKEAAIIRGMEQGKTLFELLDLPKAMAALGLELPSKGAGK